MKAILKINDKEIEVEVSEEQIKKLTEKKNSPFERRVLNEDYYSIMSRGEVYNIIEGCSPADDGRFDSANYCTDRDLIQQQAYRETLNRLLWRWQYENDEPCDWGNGYEFKYYICTLKDYHSFFVETACSRKTAIVYFSTEAKANQAIEEIVKPFMAEHPDFVW